MSKTCRLLIQGKKICTRTPRLVRSRQSWDAPRAISDTKTQMEKLDNVLPTLYWKVKRTNKSAVLVYSILIGKVPTSSEFWSRQNYFGATDRVRLSRKREKLKKTAMEFFVAIVYFASIWLRLRCFISLHNIPTSSLGRISLRAHIVLSWVCDAIFGCFQECRRLLRKPKFSNVDRLNTWLVVGERLTSLVCGLRVRHDVSALDRR